VANVVLEFKVSAGDSEPQNRPVLILGQLNNLQQATWTQVMRKLQPVTSQLLAAIVFLLFITEGTCTRRTHVNHVYCRCLYGFTCVPDDRNVNFSTDALKSWLNNTFLWILYLKFQEIKAVGTELGITPVIIRGEELKQKGFGGTIYGVGKAVVNPPALAVLSHKPDGATQTIAWVGKGIVYDTGGLHQHAWDERDCGEAAAILGAFKATVNQGFKDNLHAVFCLAENAVGPTATRPDDIHTLYSGKSMEINNTDAEGRLVLSDGVVYASKDLSADIILDMATGFIKLLIVECCPTPLQWLCEVAGFLVGTGTLCHTLIESIPNITPRAPVPASIGSHLGFDWPGVWVHVDIASPFHAGERTTDFGVALLMALFGQASDDPTLNLVSPLGAATMNAASRDPVEHDCKWRRLV
uniref:Aminopeptidase like 1 n=1 Tax=Oncorhynchus mykiss TaxID=8022 RepID=A0A8C7QFG7_ONCMY